MKTLIQIILLIVIVSYFVKPANNDFCDEGNLDLTRVEYISTFKRFVEYVEGAKYDFSSEQWEQMDYRFKVFSRCYYRKYESSMTDAEKEFISKLVNIYRITKTEKSVKSIGEKIEDILLELSSRV